MKRHGECDALSLESASRPLVERMKRCLMALNTGGRFRDGTAPKKSVLCAQALEFQQLGRVSKTVFIWK